MKYLFRNTKQIMNQCSVPSTLPENNQCLPLSESKELIKEAVDFQSLLDDGKKLILHNDDYNTFDWVIDSLIEICDHSEMQAEQCALIVHFNGHCNVKHGAEYKMKSMKTSLLNRGLNVTLE